MRKGIIKIFIASVLATAVANSANAMGNGFYMGLMLGPSNNGSATLAAQAASLPGYPPNYCLTNACPTPASPRVQQFGTRLFIGNQFNKYAAFEGAFDFFSSVKYDTRDVKTLGDATQRARTVDFLIKGILPLQYFSVFGKVGGALTYLTTGGSFNPEQDPVTMNIETSNSYTNKFSPVYGIGASFDINQNWLIELDYLNFAVGGAIGNITLYGLGLSYHFTDKYCGQFLCDD
jgi:opacity protein-like surface antigen